MITEHPQFTATASDIPLFVVISGVYSQKIAPKLISKAVEKMTMQASCILEVLRGVSPRVYWVNTKNTHNVTNPSIAPVSIRVLRPNLVKSRMTKGTTTQLTPNKMKVPTLASSPIWVNI